MCVAAVARGARTEIRLAFRICVHRRGYRLVQEVSEVKVIIMSTAATLASSDGVRKGQREYRTRSVGEANRIQGRTVQVVRMSSLAHAKQHVAHAYELGTVFSIACACWLPWQ